MTTQTTNLQLLIADFLSDKTVSANDDLNENDNRKFSKIIDALQLNTSKHLPAVPKNKDKQLLESCLTKLK